jgi:hypothetical protein
MAQRGAVDPSPLGVHKAKFSHSEDIKLLELVAAHGKRDWLAIARQMPNRSVRQCRERWCNYLAPGVANGPWSSEEDALLLEKFLEFGPKWKAMTAFFPGRTDINIKNHYMTVTGRRRTASRAAADAVIVPEPQIPPAVPSDLAPPPFWDVSVETEIERPALEWGWLTHNASDDIANTQRNLERGLYFMEECF